MNIIILAISVFLTGVPVGFLLHLFFVKKFYRREIKKQVDALDLKELMEKASDKLLEDLIKSKTPSAKKAKHLSADKDLLLDYIHKREAKHGHVFRKDITCSHIFGRRGSTQYFDKLLKMLVTEGKITLKKHARKPLWVYSIRKDKD